MNCPSCQSSKIVKNGLIHNGKQNNKCKDCPKGYRFAYGRQFVENPQQKLLSQQTKDLVDKLLLEKIPRAGIARVGDVSEVWQRQLCQSKIGRDSPTSGSVLQKKVA